jgi:hypothetical protein
MPSVKVASWEQHSKPSKIRIVVTLSLKQLACGAQSLMGISPWQFQKLKNYQLSSKRWQLFPQTEIAHATLFAVWKRSKFRQQQM